ncbi:MAG: polymer-forming cytoskeletal protein [Rhodospirillales bacterium]|nr:polymer-forming cytoskeletal protein [Rhodospirillales bacterium]MBO6787578.1 polymer-forming cytoskeletal protein [Rhodospirillales bacterium]
MFGKKKDDEDPAKAPDKPDALPAQMEAGDDDAGDAPPLKPFSRKGSHAPAKPPASSAHMPDLQRRGPDLPSAPARRIDRPRAGDMESRRLIVGRDIQLNGEITACDKLIVEGHVEVTLPGARVLEISPSGYFKGAAEVDEADISGRFEGDLIARERLIVRSGGRIHGKVRYGRIVIESGGEIAGDMQTLSEKEGDE